VTKVDAKYVAEFNALNEAADEARRRQIQNQPSAQTDGQAPTKDKKKDPAIAPLSLDEDRRRRQKQKDDDDRESHDDEGENAGQDAAKKLGIASGAGRYFQPAPNDRLGDPALTDPNEIKRLLGPPVRFAQHAMLLAESKREDGMDRASSIRFLASLYLGCADREYAQRALRDFGCATGIIDLYPLEVVDEILRTARSFLVGTRRSSFFALGLARPLEMRVDEPLVLHHDPSLKMRGFAIKGGGRIGYMFEPIDPPGTYRLSIGSPGRYTLFVSAVREALTLVDVLDVDVGADVNVDAKRG
jgi:hypothetical protein